MTGDRWRILVQSKTDKIAMCSPELEAEYRAEAAAKGYKHVPDALSPPGFVFDELVIDNFLHLEQMDDDDWWMRVGDARVAIHVQPDGSADVLIERGEYGPVKGDTLVDRDRHRVDWRACPTCRQNWPHPAETSGTTCPGCEVLAERERCAAVAASSHTTACKEPDCTCFECADAATCREVARRIRNPA